MPDKRSSEQAQDDAGGEENQKKGYIDVFLFSRRFRHHSFCE
jgi:hypothetical protein